jgi:pyrimidine deaminase RibD-like protein
MYIQRCIHWPKRLNNLPKPMVGSVIVYENRIGKAGKKAGNRMPKQSIQ